jgi:hypothetical protein
MDNIEDRYQRISRGMSLALVAISLAMLASAATTVAADHDWIEKGSLLFGALTLTTVVGYLAFGLLMMIGWRFSRRLSPEEREQLGDEFAQFVTYRSAQRAFIVTMVAAALLAALPEEVRWPGRAAAMTLFAIGMLTLAWFRLRADA